jgi:hypothetical protein
MNGLSVDGIQLMKTFLNTGESLMFLKYKFATQLKHKSTDKELSLLLSYVLNGLTYSFVKQEPFQSPNKISEI